MKKEILFSGFLGALVIIVWIVISTSIIPLSGDIPEEIKGDGKIHSILKKNIPETGMYWLPCDEGRFSDSGNEPVFFIYHPGITPSNWIPPMIVAIILILVSPMIAAWLLSKASMTILATYARRVLFVTVIGLLFAVYGDIYSQKPLDHMLLSSISNVIVWTLVGLVLAWRIKPKSPELVPSTVERGFE